MRLIDADVLIEKEERYELDRYIDGERCYEMAVPSCAIIEAPTIEPKQADDLISRADAIEIVKAMIDVSIDDSDMVTLAKVWSQLKDAPSAQPKLDEWCTDCKEYNHETHSCPRWNRVIRKTAEEVLANNQPKRGEWIETEYDGRIYNMYRCAYKCSACGYKPMYRGEPIGPTSHTLLYCPNCGARMTERSE